MDLAVTILIQLVNWPLAGLVAWRAVRGHAPLASWATVALLAAGAVSVWDPAVESPVSRIAISVVNASMVLLFAVYPNGRFVPRWIVVPMAAEFVFQAANVASGYLLENVQPWWPLHFAVTWAALLIGGQIHRYRSRSSIDERERTRWPLLAVVTLILFFSVWSVFAIGIGADFGNGSMTWLANLLFILPGVGFAVGLIAPRLIRVDRALRFVIEWGVWALTVGAVALGTAAALSQSDAGARAWWTGIITAAVSLPARWGCRWLAEFVVFGRRADPLETLEDLGGRLEASVELHAIPAQITGTITDSLGLAGAELRAAAGLSASSGRRPLDADPARAEYPIRYQGELVGTLVVLPRPGDGELTAHDRAAIEQICRQAAPALHGAGVMTELIEARTRIVHAREEERKRLRRDLHDELAPTFAGLGLSAAAVEALSRVGDERASDAAAALVSGLHSATRQLRDVAYDLRPPVLDDRGLVAAIEERVLAPGSVPEVRLIAPSARLELPAAVESAALRIVQEAVMNARRHAAASVCTVTVTPHDAELRISIVDDGIGMSHAATSGLGLRSMRERADELGGRFTIRTSARGGTTVGVVLSLVTQQQRGDAPAPIAAGRP